MTLRIANILKSTDTPPDGILALTFTEAGVDAMKARLLKLIGPTAYKVAIYTFHGFWKKGVRNLFAFYEIKDLVSLTFRRGPIIFTPAITP